MSAHPTPTRLQVDLAVTGTITATDCLGARFTVGKVVWTVYDDGPQSVTLFGNTRAGGFTNTTLHPRREDASHLPHPGAWFDHIAAEMQASAGGDRP